MFASEVCVKRIPVNQVTCIDVRNFTVVDILYVIYNIGKACFYTTLMHPSWGFHWIINEW